MISTTRTAAGDSLTCVRQSSYPELGLVLRSERKGSESDLVRRFVANLPWDVPFGANLTVFEQPRLDSGFPDIVAVLWDMQRTISWPDQRLAVTRADIRVLHHLVTGGALESAQLLGLFGKWVLDSIERLSAARAVYYKTGQWRAKKLDKIFAVRQIVAFEAKMAAPAQALAQASRNRWFASHSYIIVPKKPRDSWPIRKANRLGVGVWSFQSDEWICHAPSAVESIPRSYASWLFNEWVWRMGKLNLA